MVGREGTAPDERERHGCQDGAVAPFRQPREEQEGAEDDRLLLLGTRAPEDQGRCRSVQSLIFS